MRTIELFVSALFLSISTFAFGQCPTDSLVLIQYQSDMDDFAASYPNCTELNAFLKIRPICYRDPSPGTLEDCLTDISPLAALTYVKGLEVNGDGLTTPSDCDLSPLQRISSIGASGLRCYWLGGNWNISAPVFENLTQVSGGVSLSYLFDVNDLAIFPALQSIGGTLLISVTDVRTFTGMSNIESISGLSLHQFPRPNTLVLQNLDGLERIDSLPLGLRLHGSFSDFHGLQNLQSTYRFSIGMQPDSIPCPPFTQFQSLTNIDDRLSLQGRSIHSLDGLSFIDTLSGSVSFQNTSIGDLSPLAQLRAINRLYLSGNDSLTTLQDLQNLSIRRSSDDFNVLILQNNANLNFSSIPTICDLINSQRYLSEVIIRDNDTGSNSIWEVELLCANNNNSFITGHVWYDFNCDSISNGFDAYYDQSGIINLPDSTLIAYPSYGTGEYARLIPADTTIRFGLLTIPGFKVEPETYTVQTDGTQELNDQLDFRVCPDAPTVNLQVNMPTAPNTNFKPGFNSRVRCAVKNIGNLPLNDVLVQLTYDDSVFPIVPLDLDGGTLQNKTITWNVDSLWLQEREWFVFKFEVPDSALMGQTLQHTCTAEALNTTDADPLDNTFVRIDTLVAAYDPNDKRVNTPAITWNDALVGKSQLLTYTIRFQNDGNAPTTFVEIRDTFAQNLDLKTLQMLESTHPYQIHVDDREVTWRFDPLYLTPSDEDLDNSQGSFSFNIRTDAIQSQGDSFENSAAIYFDFNEPIFTNTATTIFVEELLVSNQEQALPLPQIKVFPNPSNGEFFVHSEDIIQSITVFNPLGQLTQTLAPNAKQVAVALEGVDTWYAVVIQTATGAEVIRRVVVKK